MFVCSLLFLAQKRELAPPSASPVLKHPCTSGASNSHDSPNSGEKLRLSALSPSNHQHLVDSLNPAKISAYPLGNIPKLTFKPFSWTPLLAKPSMYQRQYYQKHPSPVGLVGSAPGSAHRTPRYMFVKHVVKR